MIEVLFNEHLSFHKGSTMLIQFSTQPSSNDKPAKVFYSYSHKDEKLKDRLDDHLSVLKREGFIDTWHDRLIGPGEDWKGQIDRNLDAADLILLLISASFMASDYCYDIELNRALQRHSSREAVVIPIILRPVFWQIAPFAKLQALPKNGTPATSWRSVDHAFANVAEGIRNIIADPAFSTSDILEDTTGQWILVFEDESHKYAVQKQAESIVALLMMLANDGSITLIATLIGLVAGKSMQNPKQTTLVLTGSLSGYNIIRQRFDEGLLSKDLGVSVAAFYITHGATLHTSSSVSDEIIPSTEEEISLIPKSPKSRPMVMVGAIAKDGDPRRLDFVFDTGEFPQDNAPATEYEKLANYFRAALTIDEDDMWVNLSMYESNRMIPHSLGGTEMGRDLLAQDCTLKQFTASLMHPDNEVGRKYWKEVYRKANQLYGTTKLPIQSFHKVWIIPKKATVYTTKDKGHENFFDAGKNDIAAFIEEGHLEVCCDVDHLALRHNLRENDNGPKADFTLPIFRKVILPTIEKEVNECSNFRLLRQMYSALILSAWYKKEFKDNKNAREIINIGPKNLRVRMGNIRPTNKSDKPTLQDIQSQSNSRNTPNIVLDRIVHGIDHVNPSDEAFTINENREYYQKYVKLFKEGIFRCARAELDVLMEGTTRRVYVSGAMDFSFLNKNLLIRMRSVKQ